MKHMPMVTEAGWIGIMFENSPNEKGFKNQYSTSEAGFRTEMARTVLKSHTRTFGQVLYVQPQPGQRPRWAGPGWPWHNCWTWVKPLTVALLASGDTGNMSWVSQSTSNPRGNKGENERMNYVPWSRKTPGEASATLMPSPRKSGSRKTQPQWEEGHLTYWEPLPYETLDATLEAFLA